MKTINEKYLCVLAYLGFFVTGFILLVVEKNNKKVKFHAMQSFIFFGVLFLATLILGALPLIGGLIKFLLSIVTLASYFYLMYTAYKGIEFKVPYIGDAIYENVYK